MQGCRVWAAIMRVIEVITYQSQWPQDFIAKAPLINGAIGFLDPVIAHISSTSCARACDKTGYR